MSLKMRRLLLCMVGLIAGLALWPIAECAISFQVHFNSYFMFSIFLGMVFGLFMGAFYGTAEGLTTSVKHKILSGMMTGALVGTLGGVVGFLVGQASLFMMGEIFLSSRNFNTIGFPLARATGWAVMGIFIGMIEGLRARSKVKIRVGIIGGFLGGIVGGLSLEYCRLLIGQIVVSRLIGLLIFGFFIGFFYSLVEKRLSAGVLYLLNGKSKGKEYILNQRKIKIGKSALSDISISGYINVLDDHAIITIREKKGVKEIKIKSINPALPVVINDMQKNEHSLKLNDVIQVGSAKFLYRFV